MPKLMFMNSIFLIIFACTSTQPAAQTIATTAQKAPSESLSERAHQAVEILNTQGIDATKKAVASWNTSLEEIGIELQNQGYYDEALKWFIAMIENSTGRDKSNFFYWKAWTHYRKSEYKQAAKDAQVVFNLDVSDRTLARNNYLLGMIYSDWIQIDIALTHFQDARTLYEGLNEPSGIYMCYAAEAEIDILHDRMEQGLEKLKLADQYRLQGSPVIGAGWVRELEAEVFFKQADYPQFIDAVNVARSAYLAEGMHGNVLWMDIKLALGNGLAGNYKQAYDLAVKNDSRIREKNDLKMIHYNNLTRILYRRCFGQDYAMMKENLLSWARLQKSSATLTGLLKMIEEIQCPIMEE